MRTPSRFMPHLLREESHPFFKWLFAVVFFGGVAALIILWPLIWGSLVLVMALGVIHEKWRLRRLINSREGESICTFARSIGAKKLDTHVVRAVYEELEKIVVTSSSKFPVRPTDQLFEKRGLNLDPDDLDELLVAIAFRCQRSLENTESNPYYDKLKSVSDLVQFVMAQPVTSNA